MDYSLFHMGTQSWFNGYGAMPGLSPQIVPFIVLFAAWSLIWKAMVLWVSARRGQAGWFIFFLLVNTAGIGELIYLLVTDGFKELKHTHSHKDK